MLNKTYTLALMLGLISMVQSYCIDTAGDLVDNGGDGCEWYNDPARNGCGIYDTDDFKANDMCCGCGGGDRTTCVDTAEDLVDSYNDGCEWYNDPAKNVDGYGCGKYDTDDFKANDMCCGCVGGDWSDDTKDSNCDLETIYS